MAYLRLIRAHQWAKNLFLFIPLFFAGQALVFGYYFELILGFAAFSMVASSVYIFNDLCDIKGDRAHPKKRLRPLASGQVSIKTGIVLLCFLFIGGLSLAFYLDTTFFVLISVYLVMNVCYSVGLKNYSIIDIFIIAIGFLLRIYSGGALSSTAISHWLAVMVLLLSLFIAIAKRRDDLLLKPGTDSVRKSIGKYNLEFVNSCLTLFGSVIIVAYILYTVSPEVVERFGSDWLFLTSFFVIAGIVRYLQIVFVDQDSGSPTDILLRDKFIIATIVGWTISFYVILYIA